MLRIDKDRLAVIIPARKASTRFPNKPLAPILGRPMILWVCDRSAQFTGKDRTFVATDSDDIASVCKAAGHPVLMTSPDCKTGTDRVAEAARQIDAEFIVNVQGDEPTLDPKAIQTVVERYVSLGGATTVNAMTAIDSQAEMESKTVPKVVSAPDGRLLYMSRSPIPGTKSGVATNGFKQVCIYAFSRTALSHYGLGKVKTPLEEQEDIEILRLVEKGEEVRMVEIASASVAVDVPEDIPKAEALLRTTLGLHDPA